MRQLSTEYNLLTGGNIKNPVPIFIETGFDNNSWHRPTLPCRRQHSTIGSEGLNFSVRNGKRCFTLDIDTRKYTQLRRDTHLKLHIKMRLLQNIIDAPVDMDL